jgi:hypothetical protein
VVGRVIDFDFHVRLPLLGYGEHFLGGGGVVCGCNFAGSKPGTMLLLQPLPACDDTEVMDAPAGPHLPVD